MIAASVEWPSLRERVFARLEQRAAAAAGDEEVSLLVRSRGARCAAHRSARADALAAQRLRRTLGESDAEVTSFRALFEEFLGTPEEEWEPLVGLRRALTTPAFFEYLQLRISSLDPQTQGELREGTRTTAGKHAQSRARASHAPTATARRAGHRGGAAAGAGGDARHGGEGRRTAGGGTAGAGA